MSAGLNLRLINDNLMNRLTTLIETSGWNDAGRSNSPVEVINEDPDLEAPIEPNDNALIPNQVTLSIEGQRFFPGEIGSDLVEAQSVCIVDVFGENAATALHLIGDITAEFKSPDRLDVYDLTQDPTPTDPMFYCNLDNFFSEKPHLQRDKSRKNWWVLSFVVERDTYASQL